MQICLKWCLEGISSYALKVFFVSSQTTGMLKLLVVFPGECASADQGRADGDGL